MLAAPRSVSSRLILPKAVCDARAMDCGVFANVNDSPFHDLELCAAALRLPNIRSRFSHDCATRLPEGRGSMSEPDRREHSARGSDIDVTSEKDLKPLTLISPMLTGGLR